MHPTLEALVQHTQTLNKHKPEQQHELNRIITAQELQDSVDQGLYWTAIAGYVYDISVFIKEDDDGKLLKRHPGGKAILLKNLGKDSTGAFFNFHYPRGKAVTQWAPELVVGKLQS